ncbi:DUF5084 family protein [Staphylococcus saccharolyticus]|nr:DUF5084 family protein [Staphylococcus saccharolyticus]
MWLVVYTPYHNSRIFESISKPTVYLSIIMTYFI